MIPKVIHYCWFGDNEIPSTGKKCINSWRKFAPDYDIIEWNEHNYDINKNQYIKQAYKNKRWAFVTDYVRLDVVNQLGGIYFDTDVQLIKPLDPLLDNYCFMGLEHGNNIATGLGFGSCRDNKVLSDLMSLYENLSFLETNNKNNLKTCVEYTTEYFIQQGFKYENKLQVICNITIYPVDYFCPKKYMEKEINITSNTYTIHHYDGSWLTSFEKIKKKIRKHLVK